MHYSTSSGPLLTFTLVALHIFWVSICDFKSQFVSKPFAVHVDVRAAVIQKYQAPMVVTS